MSFEVFTHYVETTPWQCSFIKDLAPDELMIWKVSTDQFNTLYPRYKTILSADEMALTSRFHHLNDAQLFLTRTIALRILLGAYTHKNATDIRFKKGKYAKPFLADEFPPLHFNLSHSGDIILIAFSVNEVGIDIEQINPNFNFAPLLNDVFTAEEKSYLHQYPDSLNRFYLLWTRKEALAKQHGKGIDENMNMFSLLDGKRRDTDDRLKLKQSVQINSFPLSSHYMASVCFDYKVRVIRYINFTLGAFIRKI